jgi:hypothetical protein
MRCALKERADGPASCIERHNDVGRSVLTLIGVPDGVTALSEGASMALELISGTLASFFTGERQPFVGASSKKDFPVIRSLTYLRSRLILTDVAEGTSTVPRQLLPSRKVKLIDLLRGLQSTSLELAEIKRRLGRFRILSPTCTALLVAARNPPQLRLLHVHFVPQFDRWPHLPICHDRPLSMSTSPPPLLWQPR